MLRTVEPRATAGNSYLPCPIQPLVLPNPSIEQACLGRRATWRATGRFWFASLRIQVGEDLVDHCGGYWQVNFSRHQYRNDHFF